jgi:hypothetical protein
MFRTIRLTAAALAVAIASFALAGPALAGILIAGYGIYPGRNDTLWDYGMIITLFGVVLLAMAAYFLRTVLGDHIYYALLGALLVFGGVMLGWAMKVQSSSLLFVAFRRFVGVAAPLYGLYMALAPGHILGRTHVADTSWAPYAESMLTRAAADSQLGQWKQAPSAESAGPAITHFHHRAGFRAGSTTASEIAPDLRACSPDSTSRLRRTRSVRRSAALW